MQTEETFSCLVTQFIASFLIELLQDNPLFLGHHRHSADLNQSSSLIVCRPFYILTSIPIITIFV